MSQYYGYTRVSTVKQGEKGVSLQEQRDAIARYAVRNSLSIADWFEERETAAKRGRPVFGKMLSSLRRGRARGVIIHKIDRSARNLKDWSELGEMIDNGIEVHFANESIDLQSRGGRLSGDIQAVVAADFIRNLREETKKGMRGRMKQGLWPLQAPLGCLDCGGGKPKIPDPARAPLIRQAFELYSTGSYSLDSLRDELHKRGLTNRNGRILPRNSLANILKNPFYIGILYLEKTGESYPGIHEPIVSKSLFDRVQDTLTGNVCVRVRHHSFLFKGLLHCAQCGGTLTGERQKGHVYYRCHGKGSPGHTCPGRSSVREEAVIESIHHILERLKLTEIENIFFEDKLETLVADVCGQHESEHETLKLQLEKTTERLNRLTDAFLDQAIDRETFENRKHALLHERVALEEKIATMHVNSRQVLRGFRKFFELSNMALLRFQTENDDRKRDLLKFVSSNLSVSGKKVVVELRKPFDEWSEREGVQCGDPGRAGFRTFRGLFGKLWKLINFDSGLWLTNNCDYTHTS